MSWETVGYDGRAIKKGVAGGNGGKKRFQEKQPKLQDFLPYNDVASVDTVRTRGQNGQSGSRSGSMSTSTSTSASASRTGSPAKPTRFQVPKRAADPKTETRSAEVRPRTVEEAAKKISIVHLKHLLTNTKTSFPADPLLWIRDAAAYFNLVLSTNNNELMTTDFDCFYQKHLSVLNKDAKILLIRLIEEIGESNRASAYEIFVSNMCHDMAKSNCVYGYLIFLQLLTELYPSLCLLQGPNSTRFVELRNSYQNRPNIGTGLLWAVGLCGPRDLTIGLKVFIDFFLPLFPLRHFSRFVVDYLKNLLVVHDVLSPKSILRTQDGSRVLYPTQFFTVFDTVFFNAPPGLNKDVLTVFISSYCSFKKLAIGDCSLDHELLPEFLRRLDSVANTDNSPAKIEILSCLVECLVGECSSAAIVHWQKMYRSHFAASALLLNHLETNWVKDISKRIRNDDELEELVLAFHDYNLSCPPSKEGATLAKNSTKLLLKKMAGPGSTSGWFPWKTLIILMLASTAYIVHHDVNNKGSFAASNTGKFLQDVQMFDVAVKYYNVAKFIFEDLRDWTTESIPVYFVELKKSTQPALDKAEEAYVFITSNIQAMSILMVDKANDYLPGLREKTILFYYNGLETINFGIEKIRLEGPVYYDSFAKICAEVVQLVQKGTSAVVQRVKDVYDGKIDLTDMRNAAVEAFKSGIVYANDLYEKLIPRTK